MMENKESSNLESTIHLTSDFIGECLSNTHCFISSLSTAYTFAALVLAIATLSTWLTVIIACIFLLFWWAGFTANREVFCKPVPEFIETLKQGSLFKPTVTKIHFQKIDSLDKLILDNSDARYFLVLIDNSSNNEKIAYIYDRYTLQKGKKITLNLEAEYLNKITSNELTYNQTCNNSKHVFTTIEKSIISYPRKISIGVTSTIIGISVGLMNGLFVYNQIFNVLSLLIGKFFLLTSIFALPYILALVSSSLAIVTLVCVSALYTKHVVSYCQDPKKFSDLIETLRGLFDLSSPNCKFIIRKATNTNNIEFTGNQAWVLLEEVFKNKNQEEEKKYKLMFVDKNKGVKSTIDKDLNLLKLSESSISEKIKQLINHPMDQLSLTFAEYEKLNKLINQENDTRFSIILKRILNILFCSIGSALSLIGVYMTMNTYVNAAKNLLFSAIPKLAYTLIDIIGFVLAAVPRTFFAITSILEAYNILLTTPKDTTKQEKASMKINIATFFNAFSNACVSLQGGLHSETLHEFIAACLHSISTSDTVMHCSAGLSALSGFINSSCIIISRGAKQKL